MKERNSRRAKQIILDDIQRIEATLDSLEGQRNGLASQLGLQTLSDEQLTELKTFAAEIGQDLETFRQDFEGRRRLIELLDVRVTLTIENDEKIAYIQCHLGKSRLSVELLESYGKGHNRQTGAVITARLVLK